MNQRNAYLIQILEKIGSPLLSAVIGNGAENNETKEDASTIASLLSRTVQLSIDLGRLIDIEKSSPEEIESLRVAMAGLAGPMIASQYTQHSKVPGESDVKKLTGALEAVMTFSDNFTPSDDHVIRLENMRANGMPGDTHQINIQYVQAFVPIADIVAGFPFGQPEKKLMQDVADKINAKATQIRKDIFGDDMDNNQQKLCELALVKSLADLYTSCHKTEMNKLMAMQEPDSNAQKNALQSVWENFDTRTEILSMMAQNMVPERQKDSAVPSNAPSAETQKPPPPSSSPATSSQSPAPPPPAQAATPTEQKNNPMAMFSKPKGDNAEAQNPSAQAPETAPPAPPTPQTSQPEKSSAPPPPPEEKKPEGDNPMAFFKSPPKDDSEE